MNKDVLFNSNDGCLSWDGILDKDNPETIILPEGDYNYRVVSMERGRFAGSEKVPACPKASLVLSVTTDAGKEAKVKVELLLHSKVSWKIAAFFRSIGQKKRGEAISMNWNIVQNSVGRAHFKPRNYIASNGEERTVNDVAFFIDYDEKYFSSQSEPLIEFDEIPF